LVKGPNKALFYICAPPPQRDFGAFRAQIYSGGYLDTLFWGPLYNNCVRNTLSQEEKISAVMRAPLFLQVGGVKTTGLPFWPHLGRFTI